MSGEAHAPPAARAPAPCTALVLAAGRGTRMQRPVEGLCLSVEQARLADEGLKVLVPFHGRPFIAYALSALADAGFAHACVVVRPGDDPVRRAVAALRPQRLSVWCVEQPVARGTAHAVASASAAVDADDLVIVNGDNYYRPETLARLAQQAPMAMAGFRPAILARSRPEGPERLRQYALVRADAALHVVELVEKPSSAEWALRADDAYVSMQCWRVDRSVFDACRGLAPSARGELELPEAVLAAAAAAGTPLRVVPVDEDVLDLSSREDIAIVERALAGVEVAP